jgi:hypothetical protein
MSVRGAGHYLYVDNPLATAQQAFDACQYLGAKVVVFETREEREALARELLSFLKTSPVPKIWVGLSRASGFSKNGAWTWADGGPLDAYPLEWANAQPNGGGAWAYMALSLTTYDVQLVQVDDGTQKLPYICEL